VIVETVRLIAAWLGDATHGVGAQLAAMTFDGADTAPDTPTIAEETTNDLVAAGRVGEVADGPVLGVVSYPLEDGSEASATPGRDVTVRIGVLFADRNADPSDARRDAYYTMRAVQRSLRALALEATVAERTRGSVNLLAQSELRIEPSPPDPQLIDNGIYGQVVAGWSAVDLLT